MLRGTNVSPAAAWKRVIAEGLVNDAESWPVSDGNSDHAGKMMRVTFREAF